MDSKKRGQGIITVLTFFIVAILILVIMFVMYAILSGKGLGAISYLRDMFRFRIK